MGRQLISSQLGVSETELPKQAEGQHNALADARHNKVMWEFLRDYEVSNGFRVG